MPLPTSTLLLIDAVILGTILNGAARTAVMCSLIALATANEILRAWATRATVKSEQAMAGFYEIPAAQPRQRVRTPIGDQ